MLWLSGGEKTELGCAIRGVLLNTARVTIGPSYVRPTLGLLHCTTQKWGRPLLIGYVR